MDTQLLHELRAEFGDLVVDDPATLHARRFDYWVVKHLRDWRGDPIEEAGAVCQPRSTAEVQRLVRFAAARRSGELAMSAKQIIFRQDAHTRFLAGFNAIAQAICVTLGPKARTVILTCETRTT